MSARTHLPKVVQLYDKHFELFRQELKKMDIPDNEKPLVWTNLMNHIQMNAYKEAHNGQGKREKKGGQGGLRQEPRFDLG